MDKDLNTNLETCHKNGNIETDDILQVSVSGKLRLLQDSTSHTTWHLDSAGSMAQLCTLLGLLLTLDSLALVPPLPCQKHLAKGK